MVLEKTLERVPWTARRSNQSIQRKINAEYLLEGLMLKLHYFGHLMQKANTLEKTLMLRKTEGRKRGRQRVRWLDGITNGHEIGQTPRDGKGHGSLVCCSPWGHKESDTAYQMNNKNQLCCTSFTGLFIVSI